MPWFDDLLDGLEDEATEDRTVYTRETPDGGERVDFSVTERTRFRHGYPETTKELRWAPPLSCGHIITQEDTPFGGYCQATLRRGRCLNEVCRQCIRICSHCGAAVGLHCHADEFDGQTVCTRCKRRLQRRHVVRAAWAALLQPFTGEEEDDW